MLMLVVEHEGTNDVKNKHKRGKYLQSRKDEHVTNWILQHVRQEKQPVSRDTGKAPSNSVAFIQLHALSNLVVFNSTKIKTVNLLLQLPLRLPTQTLSERC